MSEALRRGWIVERPSGAAALCVLAAIAMLTMAADSALGHGGEHHGAAAGDGRIPGQPDFERVGDATIEFHPRTKSYTLREPGQPPHSFHGDFKADLNAEGAQVELPKHKAPPRCVSSGNRVVVVYTHRPAEAATTPTGLLRGVIDRINDKFRVESARSSGEKRVLEMVVECEAGQVKVYDVTSPSNSYADIRDAVIEALGNPTGTSAVKYLVFDSQGAAVVGVAGGAFSSPTKSSSNPNATTSRIAITYGEKYWTTHAPVHELLHTFGAVQKPLSSSGVPDPPYAGGGSHCVDGIDVLCYNDGTLGTQGPYTETRCPTTQGYGQPDLTPIDCGYDTYFDSLTEPGEWLDQYWNVGGPENPFLREVKVGDTLGVYRPSELSWYLSNLASTSVINMYGQGADRAIAGDWNGDGKDSVGIYRPSELSWFLSNSTSNPAATHYVVNLWGQSGDRPIAGDWDGDGKDSIGIFRPSELAWFMSNSTSSPAATHYYIGFWGQSGDLPVAGDWNGDGKDTVGIYRPSEKAWFLTNSSSGPPTVHYTVTNFGGTGYLPVAGDWDNDGKDSIGLYSYGTLGGIWTGGIWSLTNEISSHPTVHRTFYNPYAQSVDLPIVGDWNG